MNKEMTRFEYFKSTFITNDNEKDGFSSDGCSQMF